MKVFLDTNVLLDLLIGSRPNHLDSATILRVAEKGAIKAVISTQSIIDASYVYTQTEKKSIDQFLDAIQLIMGIVEVAPISENDIKAAIRAPFFEDFEDSAQLACSETVGCDIIVTSDRKMRYYTMAPVYPPKSFCKEVFAEASARPS